MENKEKKTPINQRVLLIMVEKMHSGVGERKNFFISFITLFLIITIFFVVTVMFIAIVAIIRGREERSSVNIVFVYVVVIIVVISVSVHFFSF
jgi:lysylphosphatidylglycerol synthetase-like protein (DUF2156 family)